MDAKSIGPITARMCRRPKGQAPAIIREWRALLKARGDFVCLWTGVVRREDGDLGWGCWVTYLGKRDKGKVALRDIPAARVERLLAPLAHESRIEIMRALLDGPLSASHLSKATGFQAGGLYHHLRELEYASYVTSKDGRYHLTNLGCQLLVTFLCMANEVIEDLGEQGLGVGSHWREHHLRERPGS